RPHFAERSLSRACATLREVAKRLRRRPGPEDRQMSDRAGRHLTSELCPRLLLEVRTTGSGRAILSGYGALAMEEQVSLQRAGRRGGVAARGAGAAAGNAADRVSGQRRVRGKPVLPAGVPHRPKRSGLRRGPQRCDRISLSVYEFPWQL